MDFGFEEASLADLLALQLTDLAQGLYRNGLRRQYVRREEWLESPRGQIDLVKLRAEVPLRRTALPCRFSHYSTDTLDNQVVRAGLNLARHAATSLAVRTGAAREEAAWSDLCSRISVSHEVFRAAERGRTRLNAVYWPLHRLAEALFDGRTLTDDWEGGQDRLPGFLWDMSGVFERFVTRFLEEFLAGWQVRPQRTLSRLYGVVSDPRGRGVPCPRPDLLLVQGKRVVAVVDAKYRDLWEKDLPREMLYQLSVYSLAYEHDAQAPAAIVYPMVGGPHPDIVLRLNAAGGERQIHLHAVDWCGAARALRSGANRAQLVALARGFLPRAVSLRGTALDARG